MPKHDAEFVEAYDPNSGRKITVPAAWLGEQSPYPHLKTTPSQRESGTNRHTRAARKATKTAASKAAEPTSAPDEGTTTNGRQAKAAVTDKEN